MHCGYLKINVKYLPLPLLTFTLCILVNTIYDLTFKNATIHKTSFKNALKNSSSTGKQNTYKNSFQKILIKNIFLVLTSYKLIKFLMEMFELKGVCIPLCIRVNIKRRFIQKRRLYIYS